MFGLKKKTQEKPKEEVKLFDWEFGGHTFTVLNPLTCTKERQMEFHNAFKDFREWGLSKEVQLAFVEYLIKNRDNQEEFYKAAGVYKELISEEQRYREYIQTAAYVILLDDEKDTDDPTGSKYMDKLRLCGESLRVEAFFLSSMEILVGKLKDTTGGLMSWDTSKAETVKRIETLFYRILGQDLYQLPT